MSATADGTRIKICGLTDPTDAQLAAELGADFLGLVFAPSPRRVRAEAVASWVGDLRGRFPETRWVGVFLRPSPAEVQDAASRLSLDYLQLHVDVAGGAANPAALTQGLPAIWVVPPERLGLAEPAVPGAWAYLADTPSVEGGGSGRTFDWRVLPMKRFYRLFLAGGLDAENVGRAIAAVRPYAVDASSRLEVTPGRKDPAAVRAFVDAVKGA